MTSWTLARRSLRFYLRSHAGTVLGAAIATAVLTGALLVGDSVRESLRRMALARLGKVDHALISGDRLFQADLADRVTTTLPDGKAVAVLQLPGTAANQDGSARANQIQVNGVSQDFWSLANEPMTDAQQITGAWINQRLAAHLGVAKDDTILVRVPTVSNLSRDAPLSPEEDSTAALRVQITRILSDEQFGRFGLQASQIAPFNVFLPRETLQQRANAAGQANLLLLAARGSAAEAQQALTKVFTSEDAQLQWRLGTNYIELRTPRVFLDENIAQAALTTNSTPVFTYFINRLEKNGAVTPYSMVTATTAPFLPGDLADDEIVLNQWLADDLGASPGDRITLAYYVMGLMRELIEQTNIFRVRQIVPMELPFADPTLMPDFPGMTDAENCRDWDTGFPIDTDAIRDKDEAYWDQYRGTPKAFITLTVGQNMWSNRFGSLTAVRYPIAGEQGEAALQARKQWFEENHLAPEQLGFAFQPVREQALAASAGAQDFGGLFIGFSFFLIAAALMLMALLFRFALEQRGVEMGTLLAIGFEPKAVRRLLTLEALGLAILGGLLGVAGAVLYARAMLHGLTTIWRDAVGSSALQYYASPATLALGFFSGVLVAALTMWWSLRMQGRRPARELLAEGLAAEPDLNAGGLIASRKRMRRNFAIAALALCLALLLVAVSFANEGPGRSQLFFGAGAVLLISGLAFCAALIRRLETSAVAQKLSLAGMGVRSITRRGARSRATIMLLACGAFLVAAIGAFRLDAEINAEAPSSGTGGFALLAQSAIPVVHNLNAAAGRDFFGLNERDLQGINFVPFRLLEGEDASCLNLNLAQRPQLLGVNPDLLAQRGAFTFAKTIRPSENPWLLLQQDFGPDVVPAIGDAASIQWALKKRLGDDLIYLDHNGREFKVRIVGAVANSILQGNLVISEPNFVKRFPTEAGYRMFLIDAPSNRADEAAATLSRAMQDVGLEVTSTSARLAEFNAVQNTYLGTFQLLGGLGLLLGSFGLGIVLLRNVFERRGELALLLALGFRKRALRWLVLSEHTALLVTGLLVGLVAALIAVLPALLEPGAQLPYARLALTLGGVFVCGLLFTLAAASFALRAPLLNALRNE